MFFNFYLQSLNGIATNLFIKKLILLSTGLVGQTTVKALVKQKIAVTAGVRDISKAKKLMAYGAKVVQANMGFDQQKLANILSKFKVIFLVTPGHPDRINLAINTINAAKKANVKYVIMVSDTSAHNYDTIFGKQFGTIEQELKLSGLSYCILRLPIFIDNLWGSMENIKYQNTFYGPIDGNKKYIAVAVQDSALVAASVLIYPFNHVGKTYTIYSDYKNGNELARLYSLALGRPITYKNIMYEEAKQILLKQMVEWYVEGYLELFKLIEKQDLSQILCSYDFKNLKNQISTTHLNWMWQNFNFSISKPYDQYRVLKTKCASVGYILILKEVLKQFKESLSATNKDEGLVQIKERLKAIELQIQALEDDEATLMQYGYYKYKLAKICLDSGKLSDQQKKYENQVKNHEIDYNEYQQNIFNQQYSQPQPQPQILEPQDQVEEFKQAYNSDDYIDGKEDIQSYLEDIQDDQFLVEDKQNENVHQNQFLVLGDTGVGKSSFIKKITEEQNLQVSSSKDSHTKQCFIYQKDNRIFIDCPGINDNKKIEIFIVLIQNDKLNESNTLREFSYTYFLHELFGEKIDYVQVYSLVDEYIKSSYLLNWSDNGLHLKRDELYEKRKKIFENKQKASNYFEYVYNYHIRVRTFFDLEEEENLQNFNKERMNNLKEQIWSDKNEGEEFYEYKGYIKDQKSHLLKKIEDIQKQEIFNSQYEKNKEFQNIVLIGKSQVGKSSLIEQLTKLSGLRGSGDQSKTQVCQIYRVEYNNIIYRFIDTPGFSGTENNQTPFHSFKIIADFLSRNQIKEFKLLFMKDHGRDIRDTVQNVLREFFIFIAYMFDQDVSFIDHTYLSYLLQGHYNPILDKTLLKDKILLILRSKSGKVDQINESLQYTFFKSNFKTDEGRLCTVPQDQDYQQQKMLFQKINNIEYISIEDKVLFRIKQSMLQGFISSSELFLEKFKEIASKYEQLNQISFKVEQIIMSELDQGQQENLKQLRSQRLDVIKELKRISFNVLGNIYIHASEKLKILEYSNKIKNDTLRHFLPIQYASMLFEITDEFPQSILLSRKQHFYSIFAHQLSKFADTKIEEHRKKLEELAEIKVAQEICFHLTEHQKLIEKNYENKPEENLCKLSDLSQNLNLIFGCGISTYKHATYVSLFLESINMLPLFNTMYVIWADIFLAPVRIGYDLYQEYKGYISFKQFQVNMLTNLSSGTIVLCLFFIPSAGWIFGAVAGFIALFGYSVSSILYTSKSTFDQTIGKAFHNIMEDTQPNQSLRYFEIAELLKEEFMFTNYSQLKQKKGYDMFRKLEIVKNYYNKSSECKIIKEISDKTLKLIEKKLKSEEKQQNNSQDNSQFNEELAGEEIQLISHYKNKINQFYQQISQEEINYEKQFQLSKGLLRLDNRFSVLFNSYCNLTYLKVQQKLKQPTISEIKKDEQQMKFFIKDDIKNQQNESIFQGKDDQKLIKLLDLLCMVDKYIVNRYLQLVKQKDDKKVKPNLTCLAGNEVIAATLQFSLDLHELAKSQECNDEQTFVKLVENSLKQKYKQAISKKNSLQKLQELNSKIEQEVEELLGNGCDMNQRVKHFYQSVQYLKEYFQ
ncbi:hypothetical protein ABPG72_006531 [Tetrahymena utriculariae]